MLSLAAASLGPQNAALRRAAMSVAAVTVYFTSSNRMRGVPGTMPPPNGVFTTGRGENARVHPPWCKTRLHNRIPSASTASCHPHLWIPPTMLSLCIHYSYLPWRSRYCMKCQSGSKFFFVCNDYITHSGPGHRAYIFDQTSGIHHQLVGKVLRNPKKLPLECIDYRLHFISETLLLRDDWSNTSGSNLVDRHGKKKNC